MIDIIHELYRKAIHFLLILIPIFYCFLGKWTTLLIIAPITTLIFAVEHARKNNPKINQIFLKVFKSVLRPHEYEPKKMTGVSSVMLAACITFLVFKKEIAVIAFTILVFSDALSAIVGKSIPSRPFFEKSVAGSLAFFVSALAVLFICGFGFGVRPTFYIFGIFSICCVTVIEARPSLTDLDDNFSIPLVFSLLMTSFDFMWG